MKLAMLVEKNLLPLPKGIEIIKDLGKVLCENTENENEFREGEFCILSGPTWLITSWLRKFESILLTDSVESPVWFEVHVSDEFPTIH